MHTMLSVGQSPDWPGSGPNPETQDTETTDQNTAEYLPCMLQLAPWQQDPGGIKCPNKHGLDLPEVSG